MSNAGTITSLSNSGTISGGNGGVASFTVGGAGGAGVSNAGTIRTLTNSGAIMGGAGGGASGLPGGAGGAGVSNAHGGRIATLTNSGMISGGSGGSGSLTGGHGRAGVSNAGTIKSLTNGGTISGGSGGSGESNGGPGGAGIWNAGAIGALVNSGAIEGGVGGQGSPSGATGDAIYSAGKHASIGPITNSGRIIGNVEIDDQASVTVTGGTGNTFGRFTSGTITIGNGNLTFASGNTALGDDIFVDGGAGTVTNMGELRPSPPHAPETITGNFSQTSAGVLDLEFAGDVSGQYGALAVTQLTTLDGGLAIDLTGGFTLGTGETFDILTFGSLAGPGFDALALDGVACSSPRADRWTCGGGVRLREVIDLTSLDLFVARGSAAFGPSAGPSPIPEPSTWAMLALGFLGLGGFGLRKRGRAAPS